jgi:hypothetical protein
MITGARAVERNDQVAGMKGSDVRTNGECVGTRYGVMMWDIYRKRGEQRKAKRVLKPRLGNRTREWMWKAERGRKPKLGNRTWGTGLNNSCAKVFHPFRSPGVAEVIKDGDSDGR